MSAPYNAFECGNVRSTQRMFKNNALRREKSTSFAASPTAPPKCQLRVDAGVNLWLTAVMDPLTTIRHRLQAKNIAEQELEDAVAQARAAGHSWAEIGNALNISRQAAFKLSLIHI